MAVLREEDLDPDPIRQFRRWHQEAATDAMVVDTATPEGVPSGRVVLLKEVDHRGFVFYTSYESAKAADLRANPRAALVFHWPPVRQVRVGGAVHGVSRQETEAYWRTRPRPSQIGAWASHQSAVIAGRQVLEDRVAELVERGAESLGPVAQRLDQHHGLQPGPPGDLEAGERRTRIVGATQEGHGPDEEPEHGPDVARLDARADGQAEAGAHDAGERDQGDHHGPVDGQVGGHVLGVHDRRDREHDDRRDEALDRPRRDLADGDER